MSRGFLATNRPRYESLDIWRGSACLMVAVFHACFYLLQNPHAQSAGGAGGAAMMVLERMWYGVPMFFVISGYCITGTCLSVGAREAPVREYFFRRFRRIFPSYWVALALALAVVLVATWLGKGALFSDGPAPMPAPAALAASQWVTNLTLTEGIRYALSGETGEMMQGFFLTPAWTLSYEEQFYIVCGLALFLAPRRFPAVLLAVTAAVAALLLVHEFVRPLPIHGFFFDGRWLIFAAGILAYYRVNASTARSARTCDGGLLLLLALSVVLVRQHHSHLSIELRVGVAFAILICLLHRWDQAIARCRLLRPLAWCGVMCYSLYLVHYPIEKLISHVLYRQGVTGVWSTLIVTLPLALLPSLAAAAVFHRVVERRFLAPRAAAPVATPAQAEPSASAFAADRVRHHEGATFDSDDEITPAARLAG